MRISDWSSDVCSSDLLGRHGGEAVADPLPQQDHRRLALRFRPDRQVEAVGGEGGVVDRADQPAVGQIARGGDSVADGDAEAGGAHLAGGPRVAEVTRSGEYTSGLQSLTANPYSLLCM